MIHLMRVIILTIHIVVEPIRGVSDGVVMPAMLAKIRNVHNLK